MYGPLKGADGAAGTRRVNGAPRWTDDCCSGASWDTDDTHAVRRTAMGPVCGSLFAEMQSFDGMMVCVIYVIRHSARNARVGIALLAHNLPTLDALKCGKKSCSLADLRLRISNWEAWGKAMWWINPT